MARRWASCGDAKTLSQTLDQIEEPIMQSLPAILNNGGGNMAVCDGPDGLELPGLMTARNLD